VVKKALTEYKSWQMNIRSGAAASRIALLLEERAHMHVEISIRTEYRL
jgi:hypothetical protein